ncbi:Uncharacterised protein [Serratia fonticola]|nr:Uncharacterised protein [Serratia fonticola]
MFNQTLHNKCYPIIKNSVRQAEQTYLLTTTLQ